MAIVGTKHIPFVDRSTHSFDQSYTTALYDREGRSDRPNGREGQAWWTEAYARDSSPESRSRWSALRPRPLGEVLNYMSHQTDSTGHSTADRATPLPAVLAPNDGSAREAAHAGASSVAIARSDTSSSARVDVDGLPASLNERTSGHFQQSPIPTSTTTPVRPFGVQSILNPPTDAPSSNWDGTPPLPAQPLLSPRSRKRNDPAVPSHEFVSNPIPPRRMLTPKSPTLRAASLGLTVLPPIQSISGIAPQSYPSASEGRVYTAEPGVAGVPPLPPITSAQRPYPAIQTHERQQYVSQGPASTIAVTEATSAVDPRESHVSRTTYTGPDHQSPTYRQSTAPPSAAPANTGHYASQTAQTAFRSEPTNRAGRDGYRAGGSSYQMTFDTDQGPMVVPVELDLLQASKVADEKRKRNAGASARFRARRKEKEKEASHQISSLKHDIDELRAQRDFYREERNIIRDFAARHVGAIPLPVRPTSPVSYHGAEEGDDSGGEGEMFRSESGPPSQKRRTEEYQAPRYTSPPRPEQPVLHDYGRPYPPHTGMTLPPQPQAAGTYPPHGAAPPGVSGPPLLGPRSQSSYDIFRREPFERSWDHSR